MNIDQLENIVEIVKTGSLTEAARNRNITIPALSQSLTQLEKELNILLFNRSRSGTFPTPEGNIIIKSATEVLTKLEELKENAQRITNTLSRQLRIGSEAGVMSLIVDIVSEFKLNYPDIQFLLIETNPEEIFGKILKQEIDIGIVSLTDKNKRNTKDLVYEKIIEGRFVIGANKASAIASKKSIIIEELKNYPITLFNDIYTTQFVDEIMEKYGALDIFLTTNNLDAIRNVVSKNLAIILGIDYCVKSDNIFLADSNIVTVDLENQEYIPSFYFVRLKERHYSEVTRLFVKRFKSAINRL